MSSLTQKGLVAQPSPCTPAPMTLMSRVCFVLLSLATVVYAKAGARDDDQVAAAIESAIRHSLESQYFSGGQVQELLLAEPESRGSSSTYLGEFAIRRAEKLIRCEDWLFTVQRVPEGWALLKTERGRCND